MLHIHNRNATGAISELLCTALLRTWSVSDMIVGSFSKEYRDATVATCELQDFLGAQVSHNNIILARESWALEIPKRCPCVQLLLEPQDIQE